MILLLLGVSVRWTNPINPSVYGTPENRLIKTPSGWRNLATISLATARSEYKDKARSQEQYECKNTSLLAFSSTNEEATTSRMPTTTVIDQLESSRGKLTRSFSSGELSKAQIAGARRSPHLEALHLLIYMNLRRRRHRHRNLAVVTQRLDLDRSGSTLIDLGQI